MIYLLYQGLTANKVGWLIAPLLKNLERLEYHPGFPNGKNLKCPVFLQDKFEYIKSIKNSIPTFVIKMVSPTVEFPESDICNLIE